MITKEQVADLQPGDVVELSRPDLPGVRASAPAVEVSPGRLYVGIFLVRWEDGEVPAASRGFDLTVVSRAPRPLYVNHDRTEPVPGDVVRDADDDQSVGTWMYGRDNDGEQIWSDPLRVMLRTALPARLRLLVDGETGQAVTP